VSFKLLESPAQRFCARLCLSSPGKGVVDHPVCNRWSAVGGLRVRAASDDLADVGVRTRLWLALLLGAASRCCQTRPLSAFASAPGRLSGDEGRWSAANGRSKNKLQARVKRRGPGRRRQLLVRESPAMSLASCVVGQLAPPGYRVRVRLRLGDGTLIDLDALINPGWPAPPTSLASETADCWSARICPAGIPRNVVWFPVASDSPGPAAVFVCSRAGQVPDAGRPVTKCRCARCAG